MKNFILFPVLLASSFTYAQATLNASGGSATIGTKNFEYSIGEMTIVSSYKDLSMSVTQGVLQPMRAIASKIATISQNQLSVYPNPTKDLVFVVANFEKSGLLKATLMDVTGRILINEQWELSNGSGQNQLNIASLAQGTYMLLLQFNNESITYKIQKIN